MKKYRDLIKEQHAAQLDRLIDYFGNQSVAARELDVHRQSVHLWKKRGRISKKGAIKAEQYDPDFFVKDYLRPDIYKW